VDIGGHDLMAFNSGLEYIANPAWLGAFMSCWLVSIALGARWVRVHAR
jgi:hypothetical protein